ncbi:DUF167 domain-containing protein [Desulfovibrio sp. OttesenSCG-928-C06]|nr:DUF167 domain-containing protein [Desulfovibrio sp. OttesenSCG-928-C06]
MAAKNKKTTGSRPTKPEAQPAMHDGQTTLPACVQATESGWYIALRVQPGARKTELCEVTDDYLRIRLNAPAVENKANEALLEFMAGVLGVKKNKTVLASGDKSRLKKIFVPREAGPDFSKITGLANV